MQIDRFVQNEIECWKFLRQSDHSFEASYWAIDNNHFWSSYHVFRLVQILLSKCWAAQEASKQEQADKFFYNDEHFLE